MSQDAVEQELALGPKLSIIRLVDRLVAAAHAARASDIHLDPQHNAIRVRFRIDGVLCDSYRLPRSIQAEVISRIKILSGLRTDEHQAAQDGRFRIQFSGDEHPIDIRVAIAPTYYGENAMLRLLSDKAEEFTLATLGLSPGDHQKILRAIRHPYGMLLATGPTGCGKTTTLYTLLKTLNSPDISIVTIEDPIEYAVAGVNQMQVNPRTSLTFATGLRSILRQDPNVIMVGEIRDHETAGLAVNTALTGHLLLSTLHTTDAATSLPRLLDMHIEPYLIASTVNIVIGQRLVRKICTGCKVPKQLTTAELQSLESSLPPNTLPKESLFYQGAGCSGCNHTGYHGRIGIYEVMEINGVLREAIASKTPAGTIKELAITAGMTTMLQDGLDKAGQGITTLEEVLRVVHE